jgi:hypothetical protein
MCSFVPSTPREFIQARLFRAAVSAKRRSRGKISKMPEKFEISSIRGHAWELGCCKGPPLRKEKYDIMGGGDNIVNLAALAPCGGVVVEYVHIK